MRAKILLIFAILLLVSCGSKKKISKENLNDKVVVKIQVENFEKGGKAYFKSTDNKLFKLKKNGESSFADTLEMPEGYYILNIGKEYTNTYIQPGCDINISLDANKFDETIKYEGKGAKENNYLAKKMLINEKINGKKQIIALNSLKEREFLSKWDSIVGIFKNNLVSSSLENKTFYELEKQSINIIKAIGIVQYPDYHRYITKDMNFRTTKSYPDVTKMVDINDEKLLKIPLFIDFLRMYFSSRAVDLAKRQHINTDPVLTLQVIDKGLKNQKIKERLILASAKQEIAYTKKLDEYYSLFNKLVPKPELQKEVTEIYNNLKKLQPGSLSTDFKAFDINGKEYHLKDFKGKLLYIDLWATWCAPCKAEIPFLEKLKKEYENKNITFLSLDVYDNKSRWENMVKSGKITGWQLISTDRNMEFLKNYVVKGIPRFIFLDEKGNIINQNAPRPSNPILKQLINKHLNQNDKNKK